jgi:hypothetical protein
MNFRHILKTISLSLFAGLLLSACGTTAPDVYSRVAPGSDFRGIKTYGFIETPSSNKGNYESLETNFLKVAVAQQLDMRGLRYEPANPDVIMNFYIHTEEKMRTRQTPTMSGGYYGYRGGYYSGFGYGTAYETRIEQYTVGTLTIDMIDPRARKLLWEGTVTGRLTKKDVQNLEGTIDQSVQDIFEKFPVLYSEQ